MHTCALVSNMHAFASTFPRSPQCHQKWATTSIPDCVFYILFPCTGISPSLRINLKNTNCSINDHLHLPASLHPSDRVPPRSHRYRHRRVRHSRAATYDHCMHRALLHATCPLVKLCGISHHVLFSVAPHCIGVHVGVGVMHVYRRRVYRCRAHRVSAPRAPCKLMHISVV